MIQDHPNEVATLTAAIGVVSWELGNIAAAAAASQVVPNYTPEEINSFVQNKSNLHSVISYYGFPISGTTKTWREYFEETITIEIAETKDLNSAQIAFYKGNKDLFNSQQRVAIDQ